MMTHYLENTNQEATLKTNMVESAEALYCCGLILDLCRYVHNHLKREHFIQCRYDINLCHVYYLMLCFITKFYF